MPIKSVFLDWTQPALPTAAQWLIEHFHNNHQPDRTDMRRALIVVPGKRAGRRLLEILVHKCEAAGLILSPPQILTEGSFPEQLYLPKKPFANRLTQQLAWSRALAQVPAAVRKQVIPHPPGDADLPRWLALGESLRKQHVGLAADGYSFADVAYKGATLAGFDEIERWEALAEVQERYHQILDKLQLWDIQSARLFAIEHHELQTEQPVFLLGTVDLNLALRQMLDQIADHVTALIAAPLSLADAFDKHGCLNISFWTERKLPFQDDHIFSTDAPADQAVEAARRLAAFHGKYRPDEITIGVPDETLVPQVKRQLAEYGVATRQVVGRKLAETGPWRFLEAAAQFVSTRRYDALAALIRHPDVYDHLCSQLAGEEHQEDFIFACDNYFNEHLPRYMHDDWLGKPEDFAIPQQVLSQIDQLLLPLAAPAQPLAHWSSSLRQILANVYGKRPLLTNNPTDQEILEVGKLLEKSLAELEAVPDSLQPKVAVDEALAMILEPLEDEFIPPPPDADAIELLGWLDLPLDDAPALIILSFNEGLVPQSQHADAFLPNRLREHLGLLDNHRRYARDAYLVEAMLSSRPGTSWIVGRRDHENNPLAPSRLLFAAEEEVALSRALKFFSKTTSLSARRSLLTNVPPPERSQFHVPLPDAEDYAKKLEKISVTQFKKFIACRYRFYLGQILWLQMMDDAAKELDAAGFGSLVHDVLQQFGQDAAVNRSTTPQPIIDYLDDRLDHFVLSRFGSQRRGVVSMQAEQARSRLHGFAHWQAARATEGWQIAYTENYDEPLLAPFAVDDETIQLKGRIDRIDWHPAQKIWQILDYKTGDSASDPMKAHCDKEGNWKDLQLPLYRHLAASLNLSGLQLGESSGRVQLGYIALPKDSTSIDVKLASWTEAQLKTADDTARSVIRGIWAGEFWPYMQPPPSFSEEFAAICQDNLLDRVRIYSDGNDETVGGMEDFN